MVVSLLFRLKLLVSSPSLHFGCSGGAGDLKGAAEGAAQGVSDRTSFSCSGNEAPAQLSPSGTGPQHKPHERHQGRGRNVHSETGVILESFRAAHFAQSVFYREALVALRPEIDPETALR